MTDLLDELGVAIGENISVQQTLINALAQYLNIAHPQVASDPRIAIFISDLQGATSKLSTAHASWNREFLQQAAPEPATVTAPAADSAAPEGSTPPAPPEA